MTPSSARTRSEPEDTGDRFWRELSGQSTALAELVDRYSTPQLQLRLDRFAELVGPPARATALTGMGASYFAAAYAQYWFDHFGKANRLDLTSYLTDYGLPSLNVDTTLVVFSQSGETIEVRQLLDRLGGRLPLVAVTNEPDSTLATAADVVLPLFAARDGSVALQTYLNSLALVALATAHTFLGTSAQMSVRLAELAHSFGDIVANATEQATAAAERVHRCAQLFVIGRGPAAVSALEGALLVKETAKRPAEGFEAGAFRHGSVESVDKSTGCIVLDARGPASDRNRRLAAELVQYGAEVVVYTDDPSGWPDGERLLVLDAPHHGEPLAPLTQAPFLQVLAHHLAKRNGVAPGWFRNTTPIISHD